MQQVRPHAIITTPIGRIAIHCDESSLQSIRLTQQPLRPPSITLAEKICQQLKQYFTDPNTAFTVPLSLTGTHFQQKVWQALQQIPIGETWTYGQLAKTLNTSPRAIGNACRNNPIPIIIPCHRIVAAQHLGGYSGATSGGKIRVKKWLLAHEGQISC